MSEKNIYKDAKKLTNKNLRVNTNNVFGNEVLYDTIKNTKITNLSNRNFEESVESIRESWGHKELRNRALNFNPKNR
jgi:hypothetical protein